MGMPSILITEYFVSTFNPYISEHNLLAEACGMVISLIKTFRASSTNIMVTVSRYLANTIKKIFANVDIVVIDEDKYLDEVELLKDLVDFVVAIAPPTHLVAIAEIVKNKFLGPSFNIVKSLSNKYDSLVILRKCGIDVPRTLICSNSNECKIRELDPPVVVKPSMMAGSECVYIINDLNKCKKYVDMAIKCDPTRRAVIQEYIPGFHGSISAIFHDGVPRLTSLNLQLISIDDNKVRFYGNILPLRSTRHVYWTLDVINKMMCLSELKGYIGLDVVWNDSGMYVVEVNPRFTTSGIGIIELYPGLGRIILGREKPQNTYLGKEVSGYAYIVKKVNSMKHIINYDKLCLEGLAYGIAKTYNEAIERVLNSNPGAIKTLPYDIKSSSLISSDNY
ncbi:MAG: ATP-grasp domain-containing protein [Ignisphaera sp.]|uniref:ATP-grasp domain-containing protein n=1 Tax=Ignisphaera aggregans TaxID=334771 RepID=A0A7C4NMR5_9CREN